MLPVLVHFQINTGLVNKRTYFHVKTRRKKVNVKSTIFMKKNMKEYRVQPCGFFLILKNGPFKKVFVKKFILLFNLLLWDVKI